MSLQSGYPFPISRSTCGSVFWNAAFLFSFPTSSLTLPFLQGFPPPPSIAKVAVCSIYCSVHCVYVCSRPLFLLLGLLVVVVQKPCVSVRKMDRWSQWKRGKTSFPPPPPSSLRQSPARRHGFPLSFPPTHTHTQERGRQQWILFLSLSVSFRQSPSFHTFLSGSRERGGGSLPSSCD